LVGQLTLDRGEQELCLPRLGPSPVEQFKFIFYTLLEICFFLFIKKLGFKIVLQGIMRAFPFDK